jgi:hypothetical protein
MTKQEARAVIAQHHAGKPVLALLLQQAVSVIGRKRDRRVTLPQLTPYARERVNAVLLWNLGRALLRVEERKAA